MWRKEKKKPSIIFPSDAVLAALIVVFESVLYNSNLLGGSFLTLRFSRGMIPQGTVSCVNEDLANGKGEKGKKGKRGKGERTYIFILEIIQTIPC